MDGWPWRPGAVSRLSCLALGLHLPSAFFQCHCDAGRVPKFFFALGICQCPGGRWLGSIVGLVFRCVSLTAFEGEGACVVGATDGYYFFF